MNSRGTQVPGGGETPAQPEWEGATRWLLFASSTPDASSDLPVAIFRDEAQARRAFVDERLRSADPGAWAELTAVDDAGHTRVACWFGSMPMVGGDRALNEGASRSEPVAQPAKARRWRKSVGVLAVMAAVVVGVTWLVAHDGPTSSRRTGAAQPSPLPTAPVGVPIGYVATGTISESYSPGESRHWYPADGHHQVTVLVGTLSTDDGSDHRIDYAAGATYVAGWSPYTVSNRTEEPVTVTVRFLRPVSDQDAAAPRGSEQE